MSSTSSRAGPRLPGFKFRTEVSREGPTATLLPVYPLSNSLSNRKSTIDYALDLNLVSILLSLSLG